MKIQFVAGLHGNEHIPVMALAYIGECQIVANPQALATNNRFIHTDMNRAFGRVGNCYEIERAKEVLGRLDKNIPVIDFHTMSAESEPFSIVVDKKMIPLAKTIGLPIVYMKRNIKKGYSLINHCDGVSIECGQHNTNQAFKMAIEIVRRVKIGKEHDCQVYEVYDKILEPDIYTNFKKHNLGFYPVLAGEKAYDFFGLKAKKVKL